MTISRTHAFGVTVEADFPLPGTSPADEARLDLPTVIVRLADERVLQRGWDGPGVRRVSELSFTEGSVDRYVDEHDVLGYRLFARYFGSATVSVDGALVLCAPPPVASWRWQRFLVGRVLPLAALLRGVESFHASAVVIDEQVVAFVAPTGGGKTSLAVSLALGGAPLFTDDVLAVTVRDGQVIAHPGPPVVNVRDAEERRIADRLSDVPLLGRSAREKAHYELPIESRSLPLRAIGFVEPAGNGKSAIVPLYPPEPLRLLASTFDSEVQASDRLARQLDVCSHLAGSVPMFRIVRGDDTDADGLAAMALAAMGSTDVTA